jgi:hypothetical protein
LLAGGLAQLFIRAGKVKLLSSGEREGAGEMDGVVCAQRVGAGALGCLAKKRIVNCVAEHAAPDALDKPVSNYYENL